MAAADAGAFVGLLFWTGGAEFDSRVEQEQKAKDAIKARNAVVMKERLCNVIGKQDVIRLKKVKKEVNFLPPASAVTQIHSIGNLRKALDRGRFRFRTR